MKKHRLPILFFSIALCLAFFCLSFRMVRVSDDTMAPTFRYGQRVLVKTWGAPKRGDVVLFDTKGIRHPQIPNAGVRLIFMKRVIGLPGDRVIINKDQILVNDEPAGHPSSNTTATSPNSRAMYRDIQDLPHRDITVPEGQCYVVGDNLETSLDSRVFGVVPLDNIRGVIR